MEIKIKFNVRKMMGGETVLLTYDTISYTYCEFLKRRRKGRIANVFEEIVAGILPN